MSEWFRTDIGPHFLDCLKFSERQISIVYSDNREWPWTILGLAALVQAGCALYLDERDTMGVATLSDSCKKKTIAALQYNSEEEIPKPYMAPPKILLKRVQKESDKIILSTENQKDLLNLIDFRNEFTHLTPKDWSLQATGLPRMAKAVFVLTQGILSDAGLFRRISNAEREHAKKQCNFGLEHCEKLGIVS